MEKKQSRKLSKVNYFHLNNAQSKLCFLFLYLFPPFFHPQTHKVAREVKRAELPWLGWQNNFLFKVFFIHVLFVYVDKLLKICWILQRF